MVDHAVNIILGQDGVSRVRTRMVKNTKKSTLAKQVRINVLQGSQVFTDALNSYDDLDEDYVHGVIDHAEKYVEGKVHTNGIENFWSLLKRGRGSRRPVRGAQANP